MRQQLIWSLVAVVLAVSGSVVRARGAGQVRPAPETPVFSSGVDALAIHVTVRDGRGRMVRDLQRTDFEVLDSGFGRKIQQFYAGSAPISLAILLDISGSMAVGDKMNRAREAVELATGHLQDESDEAGLFTFDSALQPVVPFTRDLDRIRGVRLEGRPWGTTSLFDAIAGTARTVAERDNRHRAVLVVTDGLDTGSRLSAQEVSTIASAIDVPVYLVTVANPLDHPGGDHAVTATRERVAAAATLADLARWTGGDLRIVSARAHAVKELEDLFAELRYQYVIIIEPGPRPGWHPLEVRMRNHSHTVRARQGYITEPRPAGS